jgi:uncharacterized membrane protein
MDRCVNVDGEAYLACSPLGDRAGLRYKVSIVINPLVLMNGIARARTTAYARSPLWLPLRQARAFAMGSLASFVLLVLHQGRYSIVAGVIAAIVLDLGLVFNFVARLSPAQTRDLMLSRRGLISKALLYDRMLLGVMASIAFLNISLRDASSHHASLSVDIAMYSLGILAIWAELQLSFALTYASVFFAGNPTRLSDGDESKELIFAGSDPPVFLDFLYVATTVALTFSMSDVSVESSRLRRIVLFHALLSFFFYSLILSVVANLVVTT